MRSAHGQARPAALDAVAWARLHVNQVSGFPGQPAGYVRVLSSGGAFVGARDNGAGVVVTFDDDLARDMDALVVLLSMGTPLTLGVKELARSGSGVSPPSVTVDFAWAPPSNDTVFTIAVFRPRAT